MHALLHYSLMLMSSRGACIVCSLALPLHQGVLFDAAHTVRLLLLLLLLEQVWLT